MPEQDITEAVKRLHAIGEKESADALKVNDQNNYRFWQGWVAALDRVVAMIPDRLPH